MPIEFRCDQCQRLLRVPEENAGARARCPQCSHVQAVPAASTTGQSAGFDSGNQQSSASPETGSTGGMPSSGDSFPGVNTSGSDYPGSGSVGGGTSNPFAETPQGNPYSDNPYESPYASGYEPVRASRDSARSRVMAPAIIMLIFGSLSSLMLVFATIVMVVELAGNGDPDMVFGLFMYGFALLMQAIVVVGSISMIRLKSYGLALTGTIISLICGLCSWLSLPFSIWALVVLCDSEVKSQFR